MVGMTALVWWHTSVTSKCVQGRGHVVYDADHKCIPDNKDASPNKHLTSPGFPWPAFLCPLPLFANRKKSLDNKRCLTSSPPILAAPSQGPPGHCLCPSAPEDIYLLFSRSINATINTQPVVDQRDIRPKLPCPEIFARHAPFQIILDDVPVRVQNEPSEAQGDFHPPLELCLALHISPRPIDCLRPWYPLLKRRRIHAEEQVVTIITRHPDIAHSSH